MSIYRALVGRSLVAGAIVAIVIGAPNARAQNDDVVEEDQPQPPVNVVVRGFTAQVQNFDQVDQLVFTRWGGSASARAKLDAALLMRITEVDHACGISEAQRSKLHLAGRGDIKRFYDKVEAVKRKFQRGQNDPNSNIWQDIQPLQAELNSGLFGDNSIYAKMIRRTLNPEQSAQFEASERERTTRRFRTTVEWFIAHLDKGLGLSEDQRKRFGEVLLKEARPPRRFGGGDYWYLMLQISTMPESELKALFDQPQWRLLSRQFAQAKAMVDRLRRAGVLTDDDIKVLDAPRVPPVPK
jgi:hypothetical protein